MITIKSDQEKQLSFELEISGSANEPDVRLVMETRKGGLKLMFPAEMDHGTARVVIPELGPILEAFGERKVSLQLETILDGDHSVIWEDSNVEIEEPVKITTKKPVVENNTKTDTRKIIKVKGIDETEIKKDPEADDSKIKFDIDPDDETTGEAKNKKKTLTKEKSYDKKEKRGKVSMKELFIEEE
jgi:hypothetical protein